MQLSLQVYFFIGYFNCLSCLVYAIQIGQAIQATSKETEP